MPNAATSSMGISKCHQTGASRKGSDLANAGVDECRKIGQPTRNKLFMTNSTGALSRGGDCFLIFGSSHRSNVSVKGTFPPPKYSINPKVTVSPPTATSAHSQNDPQAAT